MCQDPNGWVAAQGGARKLLGLTSFLAGSKNSSTAVSAVTDTVGLTSSNEGTGNMFMVVGFEVRSDFCSPHCHPAVLLD